MAKLSARGRTILASFIKRFPDIEGVSEREHLFRYMSDGKVLSNSRWRGSDGRKKDLGWSHLIKPFNGSLEKFKELCIKKGYQEEQIPG